MGDHKDETNTIPWREFVVFEIAHGVVRRGKLRQAVVKENSLQTDVNCQALIRLRSRYVESSVPRRDKILVTEVEAIGVVVSVTLKGTASRTKTSSHTASRSIISSYFMRNSGQQ